ncbi:uncharacterized protein LOC124613824 [Schistocerca americana]|uniref:uncharacterized protein LOC124613824 n=1 Tax=Schistocerca americana TaxID=7009 RepID=UPI001F4FA49C|nr:uncharacterized protein LOC124613824 [Schistocerca americana]
MENHQKSYCPGDNITIDKMLPGFHGTCIFRQYIPSKPNKYVIKMFALLDAKMIRTMNMEICVGLQSQCPICVSKKPTEVVDRMAKRVFGSGRNIAAHYWCSNFDLVHYFDNGIDVQSGQKNKPEIVSFCNSTNNGTDTAGQMYTTYNVSRNAKHWSVTMYFTTLEVGGINSHVNLPWKSTGETAGT